MILALLIVSLTAALVACVLLFYSAGEGAARAALTEMAVDLIREVEDSECTGRAKMEHVVHRLAANVPGLFEKAITQEMLEKMAQDLYDSMAEFAKKKERRNST